VGKKALGSRLALQFLGTGTYEKPSLRARTRGFEQAETKKVKVQNFMILPQELQPYQAVKQPK